MEKSIPFLVCAPNFWKVVEGERDQPFSSLSESIVATKTEKENKRGYGDGVRET